MSDQQGGTPPVGWRPPEPASEATFVAPPPPAPPPDASGWPSPEATRPAPAWPPPPVTTPSQPAWPPPPASATAPWPPVAAPGPRTSVLVVVAGIFLLVVGLLTLGMGGLLLLGSALFAGAQGSAELESVVGGNLADAFAGVFAVIGGVALVWGLLEIVGSIGMFAHRAWGRAIGLVVGALGLLVWGLSFLSAVGGGPDAGSSIAFTGALAAGYGLTVVALVTGSAHFRRA
jgi:hypothetical protein